MFVQNGASDSCGQEDGDQQQDATYRDEHDPDAGVPLVRETPAEEKTDRQEHGRTEQAAGSQSSLAMRPTGYEAKRAGEDQIEHRQQRAMGVGQRPHVSARGVGDLEVPADLEAVQALEKQPQQEKEQQSNPAEPQVTPDERRDFGRFRMSRVIVRARGLTGFRAIAFRFDLLAPAAHATKSSLESTSSQDRGASACRL